jgi:16S rRNA processing protein RimM
VVGTIEHVDDSTLNLLFEVTTDAGDEILIPASNDLIEEVSAEKKEIRMAIPEGLLDL